MQTLTQIHKELINNPSLLKLYAKKNCRHCYGRGIQNFSIPIEINAFGEKSAHEYSDFCRCVLKTIKRERESGKNNSPQR